MKESENVDILIEGIGQHWDVWREVQGMSQLSGKNKRIDLIIRSKEFFEGKKLMFGVECKRPTLTSFNDYSRWFKQSVVYTQCLWGNTGISVPILVYPRPEPHGNEDFTYAFERIMGAFGIGVIDCVEYKKDFGQGKKNWQIKMSDTPIWSTFYGFNKAMAKMNFEAAIEL